MHKPFALSFVACMFLLINLSFGQIQTFYKAADAAHFKVDSSITVQDGSFTSPSWSGLQNLEVKDAVTLRVNDSSYLSNFTYTVGIHIEYYTSPSSGATTVDTSLTVSYKRGQGSTYKGLDNYVFTGAYKIITRITSFNNHSTMTPAAGVLQLSSSIIINRRYPFAPATAVGPSFSIADNQLQVSWSPVTGAQEYDLEYTTINNGNPWFAAVDAKYKGTSGLTDDSLKKILNQVFRNNATRITTKSNTYSGSMLSTDTYLLTRIRQVQYTSAGIRQTGNWDYSHSTGFSIWSLNWNEPGLNWQYSAAFAEDGKKKEVNGYYDGTLRGRQTVTISNSDTVALAQENIYDQFGRVTASILPAPYKDTSAVPFIHYIQNFNLNPSGNPYTGANVESVSAANCEFLPDSLKTSAGASRYYSSRNQFLSNRPYNKFIPDAAGYPLSVTEYTADNTGRIKEQGGVGLMLQPGAATPSKTTKYYYGKPDQWELDQLFGNDVGYAEHYLKNMVVDPNGQTSVSYLNASGKTIATALAGAVPASMDTISTYKRVTGYLQHIRILKPEQFTFNSTDLKLTASATYLNSVVDTGRLYFNVKKLIDYYPGGDFQVCSNCYYNLRVKVVNDCGGDLATDTIAVGSLTPNPADTTIQYASVPVNFSKPGAYYVSLELVFDNSVIDKYTDNFVSQSLRNGVIEQPFSYIKRRYLDSIDVSGCYSDCHTCQTLLGGQAQFAQALKDEFLSLKVDAQDVTGSTFNDWAKALYDSLENKCTALQPGCTESPCSAVESQMEQDVSPGGQYALFDANGNPLEPTINVISVVQSGHTAPNWRLVFPVIADHSDSTYKSGIINLSNGAVTSVYDTTFTLKQLVAYWKPEWAVKFLPYHPEYCQLQFCTNNSDAESWDIVVQQQINHAADVHLIPGGSGLVYKYTNPSDWLLDTDPFFNGTGNGTALKAYMRDDLLKYSKNVLLKLDTLNGIKGLMAYVDYELYCSDLTGTTNSYSGKNAWTYCIPNPDCRVPDREWTTYRTLYFQLKNKYYDQLRNSTCGSNCPIGQPLVYTPVQSCPDATEFAIQADTGATAACPGQQSVIVAHNAGSLKQAAQVTLYYPPAVDDPSLVHQVIIPAGKLSASFCVPDSIAVTGILVQGATCKILNDTTFRVVFMDTTDPGYPNSPGCPATVFQPRKSWIELHDAAGHLVPATDTVVVRANYTYYTAAQPGVPKTDSTSGVFIIYPGKDSSRYDHYVGHTDMECDHGYTDRSFDCVRSIIGANLASGTSTCTGYRAPTNYNTVEISNGPDPNPPPPDPPGCPNQVGSRIRVTFKDRFHQTIPSPGYVAVDVHFTFYAADHTTQVGTLDRVITISPDSTHADLQYTSSVGPESCNLHWGWRFADPTCLVSIKGAGLALSNISTCAGFTDSLEYNPPGACPDVYSSKISRFPALGSSQSGQVDTLGLISSTASSIQSQVNDLCNGNAGSWMQALKTGLDSLHIDSTMTAYQNLRAAFITICEAGGDLTHPMGASDLTGDPAPSVPSTYSSFGNAITGIILSGKKFTPSMNPYLINSIAPYSPSQQAVPKVISTTNADICTLLQQLTAKAATAGLNLYDYMTVTYKSAMTLSRADVDNLQQSCNNCRFVLAQDLTLPVFLDPGSKGVIKRTEYLAAKDTLLAKFGGHLDTLNDNYQLIYSAFMDQRFGFTLNYDDYRSYDILLATDTSALLANRPVYGIQNPDNYACVKIALDNAVGNGKADYAAYLAGERLKFRNDYISHCSAAQVNATLTARQQLYHFTLYYYDQADNLVRTIPPMGITPVDTAYFARIDSARDSGDTTKMVYPAHILRTTYTYNSTNQVSRQSSPDGGVNRFWYDLLSRLIISQNDKQSPGHNYSYTAYDVLGRITEVGQKNQASLDIGNPDYLSADTAASFLSAGTNSQITKTYYDAAAPNSNNMLTGLTQNFLRKRVSAMVTLDSEAGNVTSGLYYNYDLDGNVKTLYRQVPGLGTRTISYEYDLVSGKVNFVRYQDHQPDRFYYSYDYDAENRLTAARSGTEAIVDDYSGSSLAGFNQRMDAAYSYYLHGPLARMELGDSHGKVQGTDYAYTLQGWLKGVNSTYVLPDYDMGGDGYTPRPEVAQDAYGFNMYYYGDGSAIFDYKAIKSATVAFETVVPQFLGFSALYNGNIAATSVNVPQLGSSWHYNLHQYDQLNRLAHTEVYNGSGIGYSGLTYTGDFREYLTYDGNGNIGNVFRAGGNPAGQVMDNLFYGYNVDGSERLLNNRLNFIFQGGDTTVYPNALKNQAYNNYQYDAIGNMISDASGRIDTVNWTVYGKIQSIIKHSGSGSSLGYTYDAANNRQSKTTGGITTWYVRDAQGNTLAIYDNQGSHINWRQQQLYGSSRLGRWQPNVRLTLDSAYARWDTTGLKEYELNNYLGNVLATITDKRIQHSTDSTSVDYYKADIATAQEYYAFGGLMPGREFSQSATYRYGFNGKENDNDVKGTGNQQDYGMRIYDPRVGRFLSVDPLSKNYPWYTPYQFAGNTPIQAVDQDGKETRNVITGGIIPAPSDAALKRLRSTDYNFWKDLLTFEKTYSFKDIIDGNASIRRQEMDKASGSELNTDYYAVTITKLPPGMTAKELYSNIRKNLDSYVDYSVSTFGTQDPDTKKLWNSDNPTGAVMTFYNSMDHAGVVTSKAGRDYWVFTPVWTAADWRHPLAGHREFGLTDNQNGTYTFYTRGVDRLWTPQDAIYNRVLGNPLNWFRKGGDRNFFDSANQLWNAVMDNAVKYINDNGGNASKTSSFSRRINWDTDVKSSDK